MPVQPIISTTQDHLPVHDIQENLVVLKNGSAAMVIETSAVNFGLLSQGEQDAIIYAYAALLNSLNFPIQILIRSERKDISAYLGLLAAAAKKQMSPTKRAWIESYRHFVAETVQRRNVLDKKFYIILPFLSLELGSAKSLGLAVTSQNRLPAPLTEIVKKALVALGPKRDHVIRQLERIGLTARQLINKELLSLLYRTYNPGYAAPEIDAVNLTAPLVEPIIKDNKIL
ncbi:hypothetical protein HYU89_01510 [Candidatus Collierbacteria bacterium]|nr:hypothetical protein [Candidatus Collierbacteria bacterium]